MRRSFVRKGLALVLAGTILTGCGQGSTTPNGGESTDNTSNQTVTIDLMHDEAEEDRIKVLQEIIDSFMEKNPGIVVNQVPVAEDGFETKVKTLLSAGEMPALVASGVSLMQMLDDEEIINTKANQEVVEAIGRDKFYEEILQLLNSKEGEGMMGVPITAWVSGIWYRTDLFAEKGLKAPETWEDILAAAKAFHDPANKMYGIMYGTEESTATQQHFQMIAGSNNAVLFDQEGKPQFNSPEMKEAMAFYKELYQYTLPGSNGVTQVRDAMVGGNTAMCMYSSYIMGPLYRAEMADKIGYCVPKNKDGAVFGSPTTYTISNTISPEETEAAKKFVSYILTDEINIKLLHIAPGGPNPVLKSVSADTAYTSAEILKAYGDVTEQLPAAFDYLNVFGTQNGITDPSAGPIMNAMIIGKSINQILVQGQNLDEIMDKAQADMEKIASR